MRTLHYNEANLIRNLDDRRERESREKPIREALYALDAEIETFKNNAANAKILSTWKSLKLRRSELTRQLVTIVEGKSS